MRTTDEYYLRIPPQSDHDTVESIFARAWRFDFAGPGFCLLDLGPGVDSHSLRSRMLALKERLSEIGIRQSGQSFAYRSMGCFDQQETTKFHLDGGPEQSLLMLGYEASQIRSRLFLADYTRCAFDRGIDPKQFLRDFNPMYRRGEDLLAAYVTELPQPGEGHSRILLINNSSLPFTSGRSNPLGVMHKAEIVNPTEGQQRIVNSIMLVIGDADAINQEQQQEFATTDRISPKLYAG